MKAPAGKRYVLLPEPKTGSEFSDLHSRGAERHGLRWLIANEQASRHLMGSGADLSDPALKLLVSGVLLRVLNQLYPEQTGTPDASKLPGDKA